MGIIYLLVTFFLFALISVCIKILLKDNSIDIYTLAFFRFSIAALVLLAVQYFRTKKLKVSFRSKWTLLGGLGLGLDFLFFNLGLKYTTATAASLLANATHMIAMGVFGWIWLKENAGIYRVIGFAATLAGMVFVCLGGQDAQSAGSLFSSQYFLGNIIIILGGFTWTLYGVAQKMTCNDGATIERTIPVFIIGTAVTGLSAIPKFGGLKPLGLYELAALLVLCVFCTGLSYAALAKALKTVDIVVAGVMGSLTPVFTVAIAHFSLKETLTLSVILGMIGVLAGTVLMVFQEKSDPVV